MLCSSNGKTPVVEIIRGDDKDIVLTFKDSNGDAIDTTGWTIKFTVAKSIPASTVTDDDDAVITKTVAGTDTGIVTISILSSDTNDLEATDYKADIQVKNASNKIHSTKIFTFRILADITRLVA